MSIDYIKTRYDVPAEIGRVIKFDGRSGIIVGSHGGHLKVNFDDKKPNQYEYIHPTWNVEYGEIGKIRQLTRSQQRYQEWKKSESDLTFAEWCGMDKKSKADRDYWRSERVWRETV